MSRRRFLRGNTAFSANGRRPVQIGPLKPVKQEPEKMNIIPPKVDQINISLKKDDHILVKSNHDPNMLRQVRIIQDDKIVTDYVTEFTDAYTTKITTNNDIEGILKINHSNETHFGDLEIIREMKTCIFRIPISLEEDHDISITSFIINGVEQLSEKIDWDVLNMYFITPEDKICKYDYSEMFNKLFALTNFKSQINPDFNAYKTEQIQLFTWPAKDTWSIKTTNFSINSEDLEAIKTIPVESNIIEWEEIDGIWESMWVSLNGNKEIKTFKGEFKDVIEKLLPSEWEYLYDSIIYPSQHTFCFCMRRGEEEYIFRN